MAVPVLQTSASSARFASTTNWTSSKPSGVVAGDLLIGFFMHITANAMNVLSGWTAGPSNTSGSVGFITQYRIADGTEGSTFAFTFTGGTTGKSCIVRISGAAATSPLDGNSSNNTGTVTTPLAVASFNTSKSDVLLLGVGMVSSSSTANKSATLNPSTGWSKIVDDNTANTEQYEIYTKSQAAPGAVGAINWSWSAGSSGAYLELGIAPPAQQLPPPAIVRTQALQRAAVV